MTENSSGQDGLESKQPRLLEETRRILRLHHYSIHTERSYVDWIVRFVRFHRMERREDLFPGEPKIEAFLSHLATAWQARPSQWATARQGRDQEKEVQAAGRAGA
jgi:Phage integrase, N-terminal SAM-like domain